MTLHLAAAATDLIADYRPPRPGSDELLGADGQVRPAWRTFLEQFETIGPAGREAVARTTEQQLLESGIAFNVHADPEDRQAAWRLDLLPVIIEAKAWRELEAGLKQRARLIEAVLADLYGPQRLLRSGVLPPSLVFGNPEYLHPCAGWPRSPKRYLHIYACDVARDPGGGWRVLADQIDAPAGNGWLLASRVALSQGMGELYLEGRVRRVAGYYARLQSGLQAAAAGEEGRIVVLSTGPEDPGFFSHAYLARYLGYALVEAADLTEREGQLYLKTLEGLQRVDLVLRKIGGRLADPLILPNRTGGGTPGLVQAARLGRTVIANALGSGVLQNRALAGFSNALSETLLGEPALLAEAPALWLGDPVARERVLEEPGWVVSRLTARHDPGARGDRVDPLPALDDDDARRQFLAREGHLWIAEQPSPLPTTPVFEAERLAPMHYWAMRVFVAIDDEGCHVLPGGLVRQSPEPAIVGLPNGFGSKDLWVLREPGDVQAPSLLSRRLAHVHLRRTGRDLLSRTAENLFWLGRYSERAENVLRVLRAALNRLIEDGGPDRQAHLLTTLLAIHLPGGVPAAADHRAHVGLAIECLMHSPEPPFGIRRSLDGTRRNATLARGVLSQDGWRLLNTLFNDRRWRRSSRPVLMAPPIEVVNDSIDHLVAFAGTAAENMTRNYAWRFLDIGKRLERALAVVDFVAALTMPSSRVEPSLALTALLEIGDSTMTYRSRYAVTPMTVPVVDLLVLDETNPRALAFQLALLEAQLAALPHEGPYRSPAQRKVLGLLSELRLVDPDRLAEDAEGARLQDFFTRAKADLAEVSDLLGRAYFVLAETPTSTFVMRRGAIREATSP